MGVMRLPTSFGRWGLLAALSASAAVALSSCSAATSTARPGTSSETIAAPGQTTTTLPVPVDINGSTVGGQYGFLGTAQRVVVTPVPPGRVLGPFPVAGTAAYLHLERIAFRRFGSGPDLLLVGGEDMSMSYWDPGLLSLLAQHFRVTVFDLPGTGYSSPASSPVTLRWWADETAGLVASLGLKRPMVLGWGLGGDVALELAETHPSVLGSLVLADTPAGGPDGAPSPARVAAGMEKRWLSTYGLASLWFSTAHPLARLTWLRAMSATLPDVLTEQARSEQFAVARDIEASDVLWAHLGSVGVPTLVVFGSNDQVVPPSNSGVLAAGIRGARTLELVGGDYAAIFEYEPQLVAALQSLAG